MTPRKNRTHRRAVGIVRISKQRGDETSTATQEDRIRSYCDAHGLEVVDVVVDRGRSAFKASRGTRPGLSRARQLIKTGAADVLVCWKIDRVARNTRDLLNLIHEIEQDGAAFASVTEQFDTSTPFGRAVVTIIGALAELESAAKSERIGVWQEHRRSTGATPTGPRPFGYRRERNQLLVDETEAAIVREAAADVIAGQSVRSIVARINDAGGRGDGRSLTHRGLVRILTGPTIAGLREIDGAFVASEGWEPIVDRAAWDKVREILSDPARRTSPGNGRRWLLSGLLECGRPDCGAAMAIKTSHPRGPRYICPKCNLSIGAADTEAVIERGILDALNPTAWKRLRRRGGQPVDTAALENRLAELAEMVANHEITDREWEIRRAGIVRDLADAAAEPVALPDVTDPRKEWPALDIDARRLLVTAVLPRILIGPATPGLSRFDETRIIPKPA